MTIRFDNQLPRRALILIASTTAILTSTAGVVLAQGGGLAPPTTPVASSLGCLTNCITPAKGVVGSKFRITGSALDQVRIVSLPKTGGGRAKDSAPILNRDGSITTVVKAGAVTGPIRLADSSGQTHDYKISFGVGTAAELRKIQETYKFPIRGRHNFGSRVGRFGAARSGHTHQGQDTFARCGTRLVAARGGKVQARAYEGNAGNYLVIDGAKTKYDFFYAHLRKPARVQKGDTVTTGQLIGKVGDTGDAVGCHLHFEIWTAPGWYEGGHPIDPLPLLKTWDKYS